MNYAETIEYLFACAPMFQQVGAGAYKPGLHTSLALDEHLGHPHQHFKTIHVGGTNGKGSCSHTLSAILQSSGNYERVGLYTSPHLLDFRERFRINGIPMSEDFVVNFVAKHRSFFEPLHPSFFELTTAMGFAYFAEMGVDIAIIEVGLGGRLDCTNIISPMLSVITNVSLDHTQLLGHTIDQIATEKSGIIKPNTPVVVGEHSEADAIFTQQAHQAAAELIWAEDQYAITHVEYDAVADKLSYHTTSLGKLHGQLTGLYQQKNAATILAAIEVLNNLGEGISQSAVQKGFEQVCDLTGLQGRWQTLQQAPRVICDTGHNVAGLTWSMQQLQEQAMRHEKLHIVFGMVDDKDLLSALPLLPQEATYYWCEANTKRAISSKHLQEVAQRYQLQGEAYERVEQAYTEALFHAKPNDLVFVGGSSYVVADLLHFITEAKNNF